MSRHGSNVPCEGTKALSFVHERRPATPPASALGASGMLERKSDSRCEPPADKLILSAHAGSGRSIWTPASFSIILGAGCNFCYMPMHMEVKGAQTMSFPYFEMEKRK